MIETLNPFSEEILALGIFLNDFIESERGQSIVKHTISMVRDIGLDVVDDYIVAVDFGLVVELVVEYIVVDIVQLVVVVETDYQ